MNRTTAQRSAIELLESRLVLAATVTTELPDLTLVPGSPQTLVLTDFINDPNNATSKLLHIETSMGDIHMHLFDEAAPLTVANFLAYAQSQDQRYVDTFFHRSVPGFVVQGGGYEYPSLSHIPTFAPVQNEFSPTRSNVRGTVAMAKVGDNPNSATSEFFVNLADNSSNLDNQNGGFTVFARVLDSDMAKVDAIAALPRVNGGGAFSELPVKDYTQGQQISEANLVMVNAVQVEDQSRGVSYSVSSSNSDVASVSVSGGFLQITPGSGSGTSEITVTAIDSFGNVVSDTLVVSIPIADVTVGDGGARQLRFTDSDGTHTTVSITGGSAVVRLLGPDVATSTAGTTTTVTGTIDEINSINFTSSSTATKVIIKSTGGNGATTLRTLSAGDIGMINARGTNVVQSLSVGSLGRLQLAGLTGGSVSVGGASLAPQIRIDSISAGQITSATGISRLDTNVIFGNTVITAPSIGRLSVGDRMEGTMNLTGNGGVALGQAVVSTLAGNWAVAGNVGRVTLNNEQVAGSTVAVDGSVGSWTVKGAMHGNLFADSVTAGKIGSMEDAQINLDAAPATGVVALNKLAVGTMTDSEVRSDANIGSVRVSGGMNRSFVFAGVRDEVVVPLLSTDFTSGVSIANIKVGPTFVDSGVAASNIVKADLGTTPDTAAAVPFYGVAADVITSMRVSINGQRVTLANLSTDEEATQAFITYGVTPTNFQVDLI